MHLPGSGRLVPRMNTSLFRLLDLLNLLRVPSPTPVLIILSIRDTDSFRKTLFRPKLHKPCKPREIGPGFGSPSPFPLRRGTESQPSNLPQPSEHVSHDEGMKDEGGETCEQEGELSLDQKQPIAKITEAKKSRKTKANAEDKQETQAPIKKAKETPNDIIKSTATASDQVGKAQTCAHQAADNKEKADDGGKKNAAKDNAAKAKAAKSKAAKSKPGKAVAKEVEPVPAAESSEQGAAKKSQPASKKDAKLDIWWSDEMGKALLRVSGQGENKIEMSKDLVVGEDGLVYAIFDGFEKWRVPHLVSEDLEKFNAGQALPKSNVARPAKTPAAKRKAVKDKPVKDFELKDIVRCRYATQGEKNPPIIKVELRQDRFDTTSKWAQKFQIVIKDRITPTFAMNVATTFAEAYVYMNLNQGMLNFRECRNALIEYTADGFDWNKERLNWKVIDALCWRKIFPPASSDDLCMGYSFGFWG